MKVSEIIADVEYRVPVGIKSCRNGWTQEQVDAKFSPESEAINDNPIVPQIDFKELRDELNKESVIRDNKLPKVEIVGKG